MTRLFSSIRENLWEQKVFLDLVDLLTIVAQAMPRFNVTPKQPINGMQTLTNESYAQLCRLARKTYTVSEDYNLAVEFLEHLIEVSELIPSFERLVFDYLKGITDRYKTILEVFETHINKEIDDKASEIFGEHYKTWHAAKNSRQIYNKMRDIGSKSKVITLKKTLWFNLISKNKEKMEFTLYSGKK
jgi:hypothetical protein